MIASDGLTLRTALAHLHDLHREFDALEAATRRARNQLDLILEMMASEDSILTPTGDSNSAPALFGSTGQVAAEQSPVLDASGLAVATDKELDLSSSSAIEPSLFERSFIDKVDRLFDAGSGEIEGEVSGEGDEINLVHQDMSLGSFDLHADSNSDFASDTVLVHDEKEVVLAEDDLSSDVGADGLAACDDADDTLEAIFGREEGQVGEITEEPTTSEGEIGPLISLVPKDQTADNETVVAGCEAETDAIDREPELKSTSVIVTPAPAITDEEDSFDIDDLYILSSSMHQPIEDFEDCSLAALDDMTTIKAVGLVEDNFATKRVNVSSNANDEPLTAAENIALDDEHASETDLDSEAEAEAKATLEAKVQAEALTVVEPETSEAADFDCDNPKLGNIDNDEIVAEETELKAELVCDERDAKAEQGKKGDLDDAKAAADDANDSDIETAEAAEEIKEGSENVVVFPAAVQSEARQERRGGGVAAALVGAGAIAAALTVAPQFLPMEAWQDLPPVQDLLQQLDQLKHFLA